MTDGLIADDITPGTIHNYARRLGIPPDEAERRIRAQFEQRDADLAASCATAMQHAQLRRDPDDRPLERWALVDMRDYRHRWQHQDSDGRIETVCGGSSSGWLIEIRLPDGRLMTTGPIAGGVATAMRAAAQTHAT